MTSSEQLTLLGGLFLAIMAAVTVAGYWLLGRVSTVANPQGAGAGLPGTWAETFQWMGERAPSTARDGDQLRRRLVAAGYRSPTAIIRFRGIRYAGVACVIFLTLVISAVSGGSGFVAALCLGGVAYLLPDRVLEILVKRRQRRLRAGLPAALDLLVLSVEAGQAIDTALQETSRGLHATFPDLSSELSLLGIELRTTASRADTLRALADRNGEPELRKLANLFVDTDRFGTSLAPALRNHARYLRIRLRQQAQETARKVGVKLIFPVFFLIFPSVILVTLGPAVILIMTQLKDFVN
jgi:tight adherence protein C